MRTLAEDPKAAQLTRSAGTSSLSQARDGEGHPTNSIFHLQHAIGNQAVLRLLRSNTEKPKAAPAAKNSVSPAKANAMQSELRVGAPGDEFEQEADRVAQHVMRMPGSAAAAGPPVTGADQGVQRDCSQVLAAHPGSRQTTERTALRITPAPPFVFPP